MAQEKDIFYDSIVNPNLTYLDFASVGHSAETSRLKSLDYYKNNLKVRDYFTKNGLFDELALIDSYAKALSYYSAIIRPDIDKNLMTAAAYNPDNIWVSPEKRKMNITPVLVKSPNPMLQTTGMIRIGRTEEPLYTVDELAQGQSVLLNPIEYSKGAKAKWGSKPTENWFKDFWKTRVLAQWESDGMHIDPVTGEQVSHQKGDFKLNNNGTFYYEDLEGRSIYGKQVLNKLNTLTEEGSRINQYDFFDSDDLKQKSFIGTTFKNLALVGTMFVPYVGPAIALSSVLMQTAGLSATLGKMLASSFDIETPTLNNIEGWAKSTNRMYAKTQYASEHPWCWENMIGMIGDVAGQLREQRAIFEYVPAILMGKNGKYGIIKDGQTKLMEKRLALNTKDVYSNDDIQHFMGFIGAGNKKMLEKGFIQPTQQLLARDAEKFATDFFAKYHKIGERVARGYMTAITVGDTYGEAILAGATPVEATLLTLGYAAMENKLLKSNIGRWIFPELRMDAQRYAAIAKGLNPFREATKGMENLLNKEAKKNFASKLFNWGKKLAQADYSTGKKTLGMAIANGLAEGFEEVSEEALADFSKGCFNTYKWLTGDKDVRMDDLFTDFNLKNDFTRYALNFIGGFGGGALNSVKLNYKELSKYANVKSDQALSELTWIVRNGKLDEFTESILKTELSSTKHSTEYDEHTGMYKTTDNVEESQDAAAKKAILQTAKFIKETAEAEGAVINDEGVLARILQVKPEIQNNINVLSDYRYTALANSKTAGYYLYRYNKLLTGIIAKSSEIRDLEASKTDSADFTEDQQRKYNKINLELKDLRKELKNVQEGGKAFDFMKAALFEINPSISELFPAVNEAQYMEFRSHKQVEELSKDEKDALHEEYIQRVESGDIMEKIIQRADYFWWLVESLSPAVQQQRDFIEQLKTEQLNTLTNTYNLAANTLKLINHVLTTGLDEEGKKVDPIIYTLEILNSRHFINADGEKLTKLAKEALENTPLDPNEDKELTLEANLDLSLFLIDEIVNPTLSLIDDIKALGWVHPEVKHYLNQHLESVNKLLKDFIDTLVNNENGEQFTDELYASHYKDYSDKIKAVYPWFEKVLTEHLLENGVNEINNLPNTPIVQIVGALAVNTDQSVMPLIQAAINKEDEAKSELNNLTLDKATVEQYDAAITTLKLARAAISTMATDDQDIDNISGNTKLLNSLAGELKYYEMDLETTQYAIEDLNILIDRLEMLKGINQLNRGNKFTAQSRTSVNTKLILYEQVKKFVSAVGDDDWGEFSKESIIQLKEFLENDMSVHAAHTHFNESNTHTYKGRTLTFNEKDRVEFEREHIALANALHKFFKSNLYDTSGKVKRDLATVHKLTKLLKGMDYYRINNETLVDTSDRMDDNALTWWMCACAALDSMAFFDNYRMILDPEATNPIASLPLLTMSIFEAIAALTNGDMFDLFGAAIKEVVVTDWNSKTPEEKDAIIGLKGTMKLPVTDLVEEINGSDVIPNYTRILFLEGIAGSGKSVGITIPMLKLLQYLDLKDEFGNKILDRGIYVVHTDKDNAERVIKSFKDDHGLSLNFKAFGKEDFLKHFLPNYKPTVVASDPETGIITYKYNEDATVVNGVLQNIWQTTKMPDAEKPAFVLLDEWSRYTLVEIAAVNQAMAVNGLLVLATGDLDLLAPLANLIGRRKEVDSLYPTRNITPRTSKMGMSMRTDNSLKTYNNNALQTALQTQSTTSLQLKYREIDNNLFGDKIHIFKGTVAKEIDKIKSDILKMVANLQGDEKFGFIYTNTDTELYKWIRDTYVSTNKVNLYRLDLAQGREGRFYVSEIIPKVQEKVTKDEEIEEKRRLVLSAIYTAATRASLASILVIPNVDIKSELDNILELKDEATDQGIRDFTRKDKALYDKIFNSDEVEHLIKYYGRSKDDGTLPSIPQSNPPLNPPLNPSGLAPTATEGLPKKANKEQLWGRILKYSKTENALPLVNLKLEDLCATLSIAPENIPLIVDALNDLVAEGKVTELNTLSGTFYTVNLPTSKTTFANSEELSKALLDVIGESPMTAHEIAIALNGDVNNITPLLSELVSNGELLILPDTSPAQYKKVVTQLTPEPSTEEPDSTKESLTMGAVSEGNLEEALAITDEMNLKEFEKPEDPVIERKNINDQEVVQVIPHMETFNTFELGCEFDAQGNVIVDLASAKRIDSGYGLHKLNAEYFKTKDSIENFLGKLRLHLKFDSNADIIKWLRKQANLNLENVELEIDWAFISKYRNSNDSKYMRYNKRDNETVLKLDPENMRNRASGQYFSCVIYNAKTKEPLLEIPIGKIESPFTIAYKLFHTDNPKTAIERVWKNIELQGESVNYPKAAFELATAIKNNGLHTTPGYKELYSQLLFWLCDLNTYISLDAIHKYKLKNPGSWSFAELLRMLGNRYTTTRNSLIGTSVSKSQYDRKWRDISEYQKFKDINVSGVLVIDKNHNVLSNGIKIAEAGHPFILRSDSPKYITSSLLMKLYVYQQLHPEEPKIVFLTYVVPPETNVSTYIKGLNNFLNTKTPNPWGNEVTPLRLFQALYKTYKSEQLSGVRGPASVLLDNYKSSKVLEGHSEKIETLLQLIESELGTITREENESLTAYKQRLWAKEVQVARSIEPTSGRSFEHIMNDMLLAMVKKDGELVELNLQYLEQAVSDSITGILARVTWQARSNTNLTGDIAWQVTNQAGFRVDGKVDDVRYDASAMNNILNVIADNIYVTYTKPDGSTYKGKLKDSPLFPEGNPIYNYSDTRAELKYLGNALPILTLPQQDFTLLYKEEIRIGLINITERLQKHLASNSSALTNIDIESLISKYVGTASTLVREFLQSGQTNVEPWLNKKIQDANLVLRAILTYNQTPGNLGFVTKVNGKDIPRCFRIRNGESKCDQFPKEMLDQFTVAVDIPNGKIALSDTPTGNPTWHNVIFQTNDDGIITSIDIEVPRSTPTKANGNLTGAKEWLNNYLSNVTPDQRTMYSDYIKFLETLQQVLEGKLPFDTIESLDEDYKEQFGMEFADDMDFFSTLLSSEIDLNEDQECKPYINLKLIL